MIFIPQFFKTLISLIFYLIDIVTYFFSKLTGKKINIEKILLVNLGALGDSIIFLNALLQIDKNHQIVALIDSSSKTIFEQIDMEFYHIDRKKYIKNIFYRILINLRFGRYKFIKVINMRGSRNGIYEDSIIRFVGGEKYALLSEYEQNSALSLKVYDYLNYDTLIQYDLKNNIHEISRINILLNKALNIDLSLKILDFTNYYQKILSNRLVDKKYFVLHVGAGKSFRKWNINKFIELGNLIEKKFNLIPVYCGLEQDRINIKNAKIKVSRSSLNLCGKTSILNVMNLIKYSSLNICNDSANAHMSVFFSRSTIVIKSRFHQDRFFPYPKNFSLNHIEVLAANDINDILVDDLIKLISL